MTFSERLALRKAQWRVRGAGKGWRAAAHRFREVRAVRSREDPDSVWHCCTNWQRTLMNKWNAREFAARHGCAVPELYWSGRSLATAPLDALPDAFVIRATLGTARQGVVAVANGRDLIRNEPVSPHGLRERYRKIQRFGPRVGVLIEAFVRSEDGVLALPLEYKFHCFGAVIGAVQVLARAPAPVRHRHYTEDWRPIDDLMGTSHPFDDVRDPPRCFDDMRRMARALGVAYGDYVRVDFFATDRGAVFNEFAPTPAGGDAFTPYCEAWFGDLWEQAFPHP